MKYIFTLALLGAVLTSFAQEEALLTSKKGLPILPVKGEYSLGLDASPFLNFAGNIFNGNTYNNAPFLSSAGGSSIVGKYMVSNNKAYRARIAFNGSNESRLNSITRDNNATGIPLFVDDRKTISSIFVNLGLGIEKRKGVGRLQGIYGTEANVGFSSSKELFEYGNSIQPNGGASTTIWNGLFPSFETYANSRTTEIQGGVSIIFGARAFAGFEYFIMPKLSIGGELGFGLSFATAPKGEFFIETVDAGQYRIINQANYTQTGGLRLGTQPSGSLSVFYYF